MTHNTDEQYQLFRQSHKELHQDLWRLIERRESRLCWLWLGDHDEEGYARYKFEHEGEVYSLQVHRYLYYALYDKLPPAVEHSCDNPWCCNMNHLVIAPAPAVTC